MKFFMKVVFVLLLLWVPLASAQQITGRFYPEKQQYLVDEPIIVVFEVVNNSAKAVEFGESDCPWLNPHQFEVDNAPTKRRIELFGCGRKPIGGSCLGSSREIPAGGVYRKRYLLEGDFELDSPGSYHIRTRREQTIQSKDKSEPNFNLKVASEFSVDVRAANPGELEAAYQPFLDDLRSRDIMIRSFAASAVTQHPPAFAEGAILTLSNDPVISTASIEGLERLANRTTRARLLEMASTASPEYVRQPAIQALGEIGNPEDCRALLEIASENKNYTQTEAYIVAGHICKEAALAELNNLVTADSSQLLMGVAGSLANTSSRMAVPSLIRLLRNPDRNTRRAASDGLATLTHRISNHGIEDEESAKQAYAEWSNWWSNNGRTMPIYSSDQCAAPHPLP
jgi:hypothetical protein